MTSFWFILVLLILFYPLFSPHFPFYFLTWSLIDHSDFLLDFRSILIEFLVHMLSPGFLVFLLQAWPFSGTNIARYNLSGRAKDIEEAWGAFGGPHTQWCTRTCYWCARTFSGFRSKSQNTTVRPHLCLVLFTRFSRIFIAGMTLFGAEYCEIQLKWKSERHRGSLRCVWRPPHTMVRSHMLLVLPHLQRL